MLMPGGVCAVGGKSGWSRTGMPLVAGALKKVLMSQRAGLCSAAWRPRAYLLRMARFARGAVHAAVASIPTAELADVHEGSRHWSGRFCARYLGPERAQEALWLQTSETSRSSHTRRPGTPMPPGMTGIVQPAACRVPIYAR